MKGELGKLHKREIMEQLSKEPGSDPEIEVKSLNNSLHDNSVKLIDNEPDNNLETQKESKLKTQPQNDGVFINKELQETKKEDDNKKENNLEEKENNSEEKEYNSEEKENNSEEKETHAQERENNTEETEKKYRGKGEQCREKKNQKFHQIWKTTIHNQFN